MEAWNGESDGFVTRDEDLRQGGKTHYVEGFGLKDKDYLEGYLDGMNTALEFFENADDVLFAARAVRNVAEKIEKECANL